MRNIFTHRCPGGWNRKDAHGRSESAKSKEIRVERTRTGAHPEGGGVNNRKSALNVFFCQLKKKSHSKLGWCLQQWPAKSSRGAPKKKKEKKIEEKVVR